jgi:hypothetical protein
MVNPAGVVMVSSTGVEQRLTGLLPQRPPMEGGGKTVKRLVAGQDPPRPTPPPEMMGKRFNCRDVHRLDCCHSPVADRCSSGRRRGHDSLLHLALETIRRAVKSPAQGSPNRSGTAHRPAEESRSHRSVDRWRWRSLWLQEPEREKRTWPAANGVRLHTLPRLAPFARGGNPEAL